MTAISLYPSDDWMITEIARMIGLPGKNIRTDVIRKAVRKLYHELIWCDDYDAIIEQVNRFKRGEDRDV